MVDWKQIFIVMAIIGFSTLAIMSFVDEISSNYGVVPSDNMSDEYNEVYNELKEYADIAEDYTREAEQIAREDEGITLTSGASAVSKGIVTILKIIFKPLTSAGTAGKISRLIGFPLWVGQLLVSIITISVVAVFIGAILRWRMRG